MTTQFKSKLRKAIDLSGVLGDMWDAETAYTTILAAHLDEQVKLLEGLKEHPVLKYEQPKFRLDEATYGDTGYDHASAIFGRNELKEEIERVIDAELANITARREGGKKS